MLTMYSYYFTIIYFWKRTRFFIWGNMSHLFPRIKFDHWSWTRNSIFRCHLCILNIIFPWKRTWPFILTKLNLYYTRTIWTVCLKLAKGFWKRKVFNVVNELSLIPNYIPLEKRAWSFILGKKLEFL